MALQNLAEYLSNIPTVMRSPHRFILSSYDAEADVLYINFKKPSNTTDSDFTDDDVIIWYEDDEIIGITILHASAR